MALLHHTGRTPPAPVCADVPDTNCLYSQGIYSDAGFQLFFFGIDGKRTYSSTTCEAEVAKGSCNKDALRLCCAHSCGHCKVSLGATRVTPGYALAQTTLGWLTLHGRGGIPSSNDRAAELFWDASKQGEMVGQTNLGEMLLFGLAKDNTLPNGGRYFDAVDGGNTVAIGGGNPVGAVAM